MFRVVFNCDSHAFCDARSAAKRGSTASVRAPGGALAAPTRLFKGKERPDDTEAPSMPGLAPSPKHICVEMSLPVEPISMPAADPMPIKAAPTYLAHCASCRVAEVARAYARARSTAC